MKMIALIGAAVLAVGGVAATPAAAQYHHGYRGHGWHGYHHRGFRRGWHGYHHRRVICNRFGRCHHI